MLQEPGWATCGYANGGYCAKCKICKESVTIEFVRGKKHLLTPHYQGEIDQDVLFVHLFYHILEKLRRECDCSQEARESYERGDSSIPKLLNDWSP